MPCFPGSSSKYAEKGGDRPLHPMDSLQSIQVDDLEYTRHHVLLGKNGLWKLPEDGPRTILDCWEQGLKTAGNDGILCGIPQADGSYTTKSYGDLDVAAKSVGNALAHLGAVAGVDKVAVYSTNCFEYDVVCIGGYHQNICNVSLYDTLGKEAVEYILQQIECKIVFVENAAKLEMILSCESQVEVAVLLKPSKVAETDTNVRILSWEDFIKLGEENATVPVRPGIDDIATINYTSGTTGNPKGVLLTHKNLVTLACGVLTWTMPKACTTEDVWYSYLPMAHIFERAVHIVIMQVGAQWWFSSGNIKKLLEELAIVRPTIFGSVPRVMNRLYDKIQSGLNASALKKFLITKATASKRDRLDKGEVTNSTLWDKFVLKKITGLLGGRIHTWISGAAPLDPKIRGFFREVFGCYLVEAYGQTETCGCITATSFTNYQKEDGSVGPPQPWNEVKLESVPEMNYHASEGYGEICCRGDHIMKGYFKQDDKTKETIDQDGWLHTGDIGMWLPNGSLKVIDRKKHIYKLSQGEYVAPERCESVYTKHPLVQQMFMWGNSLKSCNVAVVVPDEIELRKKLKDETTPLSEICAQKTTVEMVMAAANEFARKEGLKGFELARAIHLEHDPFSVENELLTPTQKAKRPQIQQKYQVILQSLYDDLE